MAEFWEALNALMETAVVEWTMFAAFLLASILYGGLWWVERRNVEVPEEMAARAGWIAFLWLLAATHAFC